MREDTGKDLITLYISKTKQYNGNCTSDSEQVTSSISATMKTVKDDKSSAVDNEINLKRQLIEATDSVRKKFHSIKNRHREDRTALEKIYEPLTQPLKEISAATVAKSVQPPFGMVPIQTTHSKESPKSECIKLTPRRTRDSDEYEKKAFYTPVGGTPSTSTIITSPDAETSTFSNTVKDHIRRLQSGDSHYDTTYGVRLNPKTGNLLLGNTEIRFPDDNVELWTKNGNKIASYKGTEGLYEMLFLKLPTVLYDDKDINDNSDAQIYKELLLKTKAPYKNYDTRKGLNASRTAKYHQLVEPLMSYKMVMRSRSGTGVPPRMPTMKVADKNKTVDYVYWNKPKELVDRLRLLWGSKLAGHTGHDNEILNIIEELREEGIVY